MALTSEQRAENAREFVRKAFVESGATATVDHTEVVAAVAAMDDWIEANGAAINAALPLPFRTTATAAQKTLLFCFVALKRAGMI
jgi:hypothetical protein